MVNTEIWMGAHQALTLVPESQLFLGYSATVLNAAANLTTDTGKTHLYDLDLGADLDDNSGGSGTAFTSKYLMVEDIYAGCLVDFYTSGDTYVQTLMVHSNSYKSLYFTEPWDHSTLDTNAYAIMRKYGAAVPGPIKTDASGSTNQSTLLSDNWLGLVETATFPNVEVEMKPMNLALGGQTRNPTLQLKGLETATGGSLDIIANHGAWLYYALGKCTTVNATFSNVSVVTRPMTATGSDEVYLMEGGTTGDDETSTDGTNFDAQGPIFYRKIGTTLCPPLAKNQLGDTSTMEALTFADMNNGAIRYPIEYDFAESDTSLLPSFTLEMSNSKSNPAADDLLTESGDEVFTRIATGNLINSLTLSANENEEMKMNLDLNTKMIIEPQGSDTTSSEGSAHFAHRGETDERNYKNFGSGAGGTTTLSQDFLNPFHFYDGSISLFGSQYLKITSMQLTINNNLQDKRYVGNYNKKIKMAVPGQRDYELTFSGYVTDKKVFTELLNETEIGTDSTIDLNFQKDNGEQIRIKFDNYFVTSNTWTIPDDKGPIQVDWTIVPRTLTSCVVKSHWVLQG